MKRLKPLSELLRKVQYSGDNLHRIAISNLADFDRGHARWWSRKYKVPPKPYEDYTYEEIMIEQLEDFYEAYPVEAERFLAGDLTLDYDWNGKMSKEYEFSIQERLKKINAKNRVNEKRYQDFTPLTPDQEQEILNNLGKSLPKSKLVTKREDGTNAEYLGTGDFEEEF